MEINRLLLAHAFGKAGKCVAAIALLITDLVKIAVHLIGGRVEHDGIGAVEAHCVEKIHSAQGVHIEVVSRIDHRSRNRHLTREVKHDIELSGSDDVLEERLIANVAFVKFKSAVLAKLVEVI